MCGWSTLQNSCVDDGYTTQAEFDAAYGCLNETDCNADCGSVVNDYAKTADRRLRYSLSYKIGSFSKVGTVAECAVKCTATSGCKSFEINKNDLTNLKCVLRSEHPRIVGLSSNIKKSFDIYEACSDC